MTLSKEMLIEAGAEKLADLLLSLEQHPNESIQKEFELISAIFDSTHKQLPALCKKELSSLKRLKKRLYDDAEIDELIERLDTFRYNLVTKLAVQNCEVAFEFLRNFLDLEQVSTTRVDYGEFEVREVFNTGWKDLGNLAKHVMPPKQSWKNFIKEILVNPDFEYAYTSIIEGFKDILTKDEFYEIVEELLSNKNEDPDHRYYRKIALQTIADLYKNIDLFIRICSKFNPDMCCSDCLDIAERFIQAWKADEALAWLEKSHFQDNYVENERGHKLTVQAFELNGDYEKSLIEKKRWFKESFDPKTYHEIIACLPSESEKEAFRHQALQMAEGTDLPERGLDLLLQIQEFSEISKFVRKKLDLFNGRNYIILREVAEILKTIDPLGAILLHRKMAEAILDQQLSIYYGYAAQDLKICEEIAPNVKDWESYKNHKVYMEDLVVKHKHKRSFWPYLS